MMKPLLTIELVPRSCFFSNIRSNLTKKEWEHIRQLCIAQANHRCEVCGSPGNGSSLECHEIWHYDDVSGIQCLRGLVALCKACHRVKHMALAREKGWHLTAERHLQRINGWTIAQTQQYIEEQFIVFEARSRRNWILDISWLAEIGIDIPDVLDR